MSSVLNEACGSSRALALGARPWRRLRKVRTARQARRQPELILPRAPDQQQLHVGPAGEHPLHDRAHRAARTDSARQPQRVYSRQSTSPTERGAQGEAARARPGIADGPPGRSASNARDIISVPLREGAHKPGLKRRGREAPVPTTPGLDEPAQPHPAPPREREAHPTCCAPEQLQQHRARAGRLLHSRRDAHLADAECLSCSAREVAKRGDTLSE
jgi:hypothetical protein